MKKYIFKENNERALAFDDILLVPMNSSIKSRKEVSLEQKLKTGSGEEIIATLPIISSPMDSVTESDMAVFLSSRGGVSIIHRYNTPEQQEKILKEAIKKSKNPERIGIACGVNGDYLERVKKAKNAGCKIICIDVAHGDHILVIESLKKIRDIFDGHIMAGNVATKGGAKKLADNGANSIRVGIGGGSICSTRIMTGFGIPTLQSVVDCSTVIKHFLYKDVKLIADGGIKTTGDMVKSLAAGADFVMLGSLLAGYEESAGKLYKDELGNLRKVYRGMASKEAQVNWRGFYSSNEGVSHSVAFRGHIGPILDDFENAIKSGISYAGARSIKELQEKVCYIEQSQSGILESNTHIKGVT